MVLLRRPTSDTALLVQAAVASMRVIYKPGFELVKAGVILLDLVAASVRQGELALEMGPRLKMQTHATTGRGRLMEAMDAINDKYGQGMLGLASTGAQNRSRQWGMRQERLTPRYTTEWAEVPVTKAV